MNCDASWWGNQIHWPNLGTGICNRSKPSLPDSYFFSHRNSVALGWPKVLAIKVLGDCQLITTFLKPSHGKRILQGSRSFKLELWQNIFMEKFGEKNQWPLNFLSKYHDWNHTNPPRGKPGHGTALWPRGVLIASSRPLHNAQRMVASVQILKLCLRWAGNKKDEE